MGFIRHTTKQGETWTQLALEYHGNFKKLAEIMRINTGVPFYQIFPANIEIAIPFPDPEPVAEVGKKAPWK